jgi:hypothetical protein
VKVTVLAPLLLPTVTVPKSIDPDSGEMNIAKALIELSTSRRVEK